MNQITKKLTTANPSIALDIAHEQTINGLQGLYDLADFMRQDDPEVEYICKEIRKCADLISLGCKNIYVASSEVKKETLDIAMQIVNGWQSVTTSAVSAMSKLADKYE